MTEAETTWLALDVGGANIKAAHATGPVHALGFPLWRRPGELTQAIAQVAAALPAFDRIALTMTAELCDCYPTKRDGVLAVLDAVEAALPGRALLVWGLDGRLRPVGSIRQRPELAAAANWLALATVAARWIEPNYGLLIDIGSTTTDLIPLDRGRVVARGRTDTERLQTGELVYAGVRRTPVFALADRLPFRGRACGLAAELFATTADVFVTLGDLPENALDSDTADGRPLIRSACRDRLARMVGADREGFTSSDALRLSDAVAERFLARLVEAVTLQGAGRPACIVVSGSGEFLAGRLAERLIEPGGRILRLTEPVGPAASAAACALALVEIAGDGGFLAN